MFQRIIRYNSLYLVKFGNKINQTISKRWATVKWSINQHWIKKIMIPQILENPKILSKVKNLNNQFLKGPKIKFKTKKLILSQIFLKRMRTKISKKMTDSVPLISLKMMVLRILKQHLNNKKKIVMNLLTFNRQIRFFHQLHKVNFLRLCNIK